MRTSAKDKKQMLLETAAGGDSASSLTKAFIALVLKEERENMIQFMANSYVTLYRKQKNVIRGKLTTAAQVSADTVQKMRSLVESNTQGTGHFPYGCKCQVKAQHDTYSITEIIYASSIKN